MIKYITFLILPLDSNVNAALISLQSLDINKYFDYSDSFKRIGIQKNGHKCAKNSQSRYLWEHYNWGNTSVVELDEIVLYRAKRDSNIFGRVVLQW